MAFFSKTLCLAADSSDLAGHRQGEGVSERQRKREGGGGREREREKREGTVGKGGDRGREKEERGCYRKIKIKHDPKRQNSERGKQKKSEQEILRNRGAVKET